MTTAERVQKIIVEQLGLADEAISPEKSLVSDFGADSLDELELVMALEEEFRIEISDEEAETCKTVGDCIRFIELRV